MRKDKIVVICSGGMDSTVLLHYLVSVGHEVRALAFNYGQRHQRELLFAQRNCELLRVPFKIVDLAILAELLPGSSQTDRSIAVPDGHYSAETMKVTVVPNRNMIMLSIAIGHAIAHKMDYVSFGAHSGDHAIYPDCREEFVHALGAAAELCDWHPIRLLRPFICKTKADIAKLGSEIGVDFTLTYSCYKGQGVHCGRCGTCVERREAFHLAGIIDPTIYASDAPSQAEMIKHNWKLPAAS